MLNELICPKCEDSMQDIMNAMCEGYAVHEIIYDDSGNPSNYRYLDVNYSFEKIAGLRKADIIGRTVNEIFPDVDISQLNAYERVASTGEPVSFEFYSDLNDGYFNVSVFTPKKGKFITIFTEITELKRSEEIMKKHKLLFECAQDAVLYVRDDGKIVDANESAHRLYGYTYNELLRLSIHDIRHLSTRPLFEQQMMQADDSGVVFESVHVRKDGSEIPVEVSAKGTLIGNEKTRIHIIRDITKRKLAEQRIIYLANHDSLTGIPNRAFLMNDLEKALELAERGRYKLAVMLFDIDKFKMINDIHGHHAGDLVLKTVANRVSAVIRNIDMIGRLGGDEFLLFQPMIKSGADAQVLVDRMLEALREPIVIGDTYLNVNISIGVSIFPDDAADMESLIKLADSSMYKAKKEARNMYSFY